MGRTIPESDWKQFRQLHTVALERFCERVLADVHQLASQKGKSAHVRYLAVYQLIQSRNKEMAAWFDDFRRSMALFQLAIFVSQGLITDQELSRLSPESRNALKAVQEA
ncbi:MAG TPA: hypothetical protein VGZ47_01470 [Gemmataceae bacterium]|jgi:hypothetical protein|nr:hypothetical protein [Gemmataceae bacterium]